MFENHFRNLVFRRLQKLEQGHVVVCDETGNHLLGDNNSQLAAVINVHHNRFYRNLVLRGDIGAAESLGHGDWQCTNLTELVRLFIRNLKSPGIVNGPLSVVQQAVGRMGQFLKRNTIRGAKYNIQKHYDLSNDFFGLFLDETMAYSSGLFETPKTSLRDASIAKFERACRLLDLKPTDHLVEIGTGWGGLAIHAAQHFGCQVTTTTISDQQYHFAKAKIAQAGLEQKIHLVRRDYRQLEGKFDKLVSIEMIEAVGHQYFDTFFAKCSELLKPEGAMLIQAITIVDHRYEYHRRSVDFIKQFIFPGGCLPSTTALMNSMAKNTRMRLVCLDDFASHYARTLACWRERFLLEQESIRELGFDSRFIRLWEYYLAYCEAAFLERQVNVAQMLFANSNSKIEVDDSLFAINDGSPSAREAAEGYGHGDPSTRRKHSEYPGSQGLVSAEQRL
ncbi:MAG: cyclopropane-fatty-acyl-phospholipid synthase family protein [Mariniblastus sp.]|nr:cyclopropane-fatty-acyl-phospholipid synthase family protein [Mariniblastus sp.]